MMIVVIRDINTGNAVRSQRIGAGASALQCQYLAEQMVKLFRLPESNCYWTAEKIHNVAIHKGSFEN